MTAVLVLIAVLGIVELMCAIEAIMTPAPRWEAAGKSKFGSVMIFVLMPAVGVIYYLAIVRPKLRAARG